METTEQNTVGRENADPGNALQILNHSLATEAADAVAIDLETEPQKKKKKSKPPSSFAQKDQTPPRPDRRICSTRSEIF